MDTAASVDVTQLTGRSGYTVAAPGQCGGCPSFVSLHRQILVCLYRSGEVL